METILNFLYSNKVFHWAAAIAGIIGFLLVRVMRVKNFSWNIWVNENLIGFLWCVFFLSLSVTLTGVYMPSFTITEAFLSGYCSAHVIFRLYKEPKNPVHPPRFHHRKQSR